MFYPLGKNPYGGGEGGWHPSPLVRRRLIKEIHLNLMIKYPEENVENFPRKSF